MKYKYFLRGFGFGILFATLILMFALAIKENMPQNNSSKKDVLSSEIKESENISKDKNEDKDDSKDNDVENNSDKNNETSTKDEISSEESSDDSEENISEDSSTSKEEKTTSKEEETTSKEEETTSKEVETTTEEESSSEVVIDIPEEPSSVETVVFSLIGGMSSNQVAQALMDLGVVDNASEFNYYMESNGTSKRLRIGVYEIPKNASYSEIANILTKRS